MTKKSHIAIFCVNYNSYEELDNYLKSIENASICLNKNIEIDVFVADNTSKKYQLILTSQYKKIRVSVFPFHKNLGYMGAIMKLIEKTGYDKVKDYDYSIFSNVDLLLAKSFFTVLLSSSFGPNIGWIAPQIFSLSEKRDRNPKMQNRPSLKKIKLLMLMYQYPILHWIYNNCIYKFRNRKLHVPTNNEIYSGHGSLMIFTKIFMVDHVSFKFPSFLFGEEIFFGELIRSSGLKVIYEPKIVVNDIDHVSTSKLKRSSYYKMNYESLSKLMSLLKNE